MATKTICDRCGDDVKDDWFHNYFCGYYLRQRAGTPIDLCNKCKKRLKFWMKSGKIK